MCACMCVCDACSIVSFNITACNIESTLFKHLASVVFIFSELYQGILLRRSVHSTAFK